MNRLRLNLIRGITTAGAIILSLAATGPAAAKQAMPPASFAVAPQYGTTHVYVAPADVDRFVESFTAAFGGRSTPQATATVTPTPSSTSTQLVQTPVGTVSLFGFKTPIPYPFGAERNGYLVTDMDRAVAAAKTAGADVIVADFPDPIGRDAVVQWPGGLTMQLYWHAKKPEYEAFRTVPENRVYVSPGRVDALLRGYRRFAGAKVVVDDRKASGAEIGRPGTTIRRLRLESGFGKMTVFVSDGHLPYPYGREITGYEVDDLDATLARARTAGVAVLVDPTTSTDRRSAVVSFPGGYVAEIHSVVVSRP